MEKIEAETWGRFQFGSAWLCLQMHGNDCDQCATVEVCPGCMVAPPITQCGGCGQDQRRRVWCHECAGGER